MKELLERRQQLTPTGETIEEYRDRYVKSRLFENMLLGVHSDVIKEEKRRLDVEFTFHEQEYYMFLVGIGITADRRYLKDNDKILLKRNPHLADLTSEYMKQKGWQFDRASVNPEKIACLLVSKERKDAVPIDELCTGVMKLYQAYYDLYIPANGMFHKAFIVRSEELHGVESIAWNYAQLAKWHSMAFFYMDNVIVTKEWLEAYYQPIDGQELLLQLEELWKALHRFREGQMSSLLPCLRELIGKQLKYSLDRSLVERFLLVFCQEYDRWQHNYHPERQDSLDLKSTDFATIEEMSASLEKLWSECEKEAKERCPVSLVTYRTVKNIQKNYGIPSVLEDTAERLQVTTRYLRKVFREDMGIGLYEYVTSVRIERAKELLLKENSQVQDVARQVGYESAGYFSRYFQKHVGMTPKEWQNKKK